MIKIFCDLCKLQIEENEIFSRLSFAGKKTIHICNHCQQNLIEIISENTHLDIN